MAKNIGNLAAVISANTTGLHKGLEGAKHKVHEFSHGVTEAGSFITEHLAEIGAVIGIGFGVESLRGLAENMDKTAKTADRLGLTTEALIGLRHAAKLAGMEADVFDGSMTTMVKNVGLAAKGTGKAQQAIKDLGLDATKLKEISPENQFKVFADALAKIENPTEKTALAMKLFGDQGSQMLNVIEKGSAGLEEMEADAAKLGLTFNRIDAAKVEMANDALTRLHGVFTGIAQTLVIQLSPYITAAADAFTNWATSGQNLGEIVVSAVEWVAHAIAYVSDLIDLGQLAWDGLKWVAAKAIQGIIWSLGKLGEGLSWLLDKLSFALPEGWSKAVDEMSKDILSFAGNVGEVADDVAKDMDAILTATPSSEKVDAFFRDVRSKAQKNAEEIAKDKPQPQAYGQDVFNAVQLTEQLEKQKDIKEKISNIDFKGNSLIRAGSAEAQQSGSKTFADQLAKLFQKQIDQQNKAIDIANKIEKNTEALADEETVNF